MYTVNFLTIQYHCWYVQNDTEIFNNDTDTDTFVVKFMSY